MEIKYHKINPTGNTTLIVETPVPRESLPAVASALMAFDRGAEQVGFLEKPENLDCAIRLQMMGGEFCGNASIAAAALQMSKRSPSPADKADLLLEVSGADRPVSVRVECKSFNNFIGSVSMPLPESVSDCVLTYGGESVVLPVVRMPGICHAIVKDATSIPFAEDAIAEWCRQLNTEALGLMFYDSEKGTMKPLVYVKPTDSTVWESSCASGSCAVAAYEALKSGISGVFHLIQPCGGVLSVKCSCGICGFTDITLTGNAEIIGCYSTVIDT